MVASELDPGSDVESLTEALATTLRRRGGISRAEVRDLRRISGGNSRETWAFDAVLTDGAGSSTTEPMILTRDPLGAVVDTERRTEAGLLSALSRTNVPSPQLHHLDADGSTFGRPAMVVERCDGVAVRGVLRDDDPLGLGESGRVALAAAICDTLADLHSADVRTAGIADVLPEPAGGDPAAAELAAWEARFEAVQLEPLPALELARLHLRNHLPAPPDEHVLVHGDYRPANVLVSGERVVAVIDWEFARLGDFHDDLGWYLAPNYRRDHFVPSQWDTREFLARYAERSGRAIDPAALRFWTAMASFRLAVLALTEVRNFCAGLTDRPWAPADLNVRTLAADVLDALEPSNGAV